MHPAGEVTAAESTAVVSRAHMGGTGCHRQALGLVFRPPGAAEGPRLLSSPPPRPESTLQHQPLGR